MKSDNKKIDLKTANQKQIKIENEDKEYAQLVVIKPVGYPFDFHMMDDEIEIQNVKLFEEYARDQWLGLAVREKSFLFDQKIIPDYGFEIVSAKPDNSIISENTKIKIILDELDNRSENRVKSDIRLCDIVGQDNAKRKIKMIEKYLNNRPNLKSVFLLVDSRIPPTADDQQMFNWIVEAGFEPLPTWQDALQRYLKEINKEEL